MPRRKQSHPQPVKCGKGAESLGPGACTVVVESDLLLCDERLLSFSEDSGEVPRYPLSEDEYLAYGPLGDPEAGLGAGLGGLPSPCGPCETTESSRCLFLEPRPSDKDRLLFSCRLCPFSTHYSSHLKRHMKTHNGEKPFRCPHCVYASSQLVNLKRHLLTHTGEKPFQCRRCAFSCSSPGNLKRHQKVHRRRRSQQREDTPHHDVPEACVRCHRGPPVLETSADDGLPALPFPFACRSCGEEEDEDDGRFCSSGSPGVSCALCPFVTHYPNHLSRHMKTHSGEKPYTCHACPYASAHYDNLKRHQRVHSGEKPYKCPACDYACGNLANLKRHGRTHSGDKPFRCTQCNYTCNQSMNLKRHMLRHTGEKPFRCTQCNYTTGHWDNYKRHQKTHRASGGLGDQSQPLSVDA